jgi:alanine racemase
MYTISSILKIIPSLRTSISHAEIEIETLEYDSRRIAQGENSLFFALQSARDGHQFIGDAYRHGVRNFVVSEMNLDITDFVDANIIWVADTMDALRF